MTQQLHQVHVSLLKTLRRRETARFSELMQPTGLQSDTFKFHLKEAVRFGLVEKMPTGNYRLTTVGKNFANNLNEEALIIQRQPKLSVLIITTTQDAEGAPLFLLQKRSRHPFFGFWGFLTGPVQWGELPEETAKRELQKQTDLTATFVATSMYRARVYQSESATLLEDGLFTVLQSTQVEGELSNSWSGGESKWFTQDEIATLTPQFKETREILATLHKPPSYVLRDFSYEIDDY